MNRRWLRSFIQQIRNVFTTLGQQARIKTLSIGGLETLGCLAFLAGTNGPTGSFQFRGVYICRLLL